MRVKKETKKERKPEPYIVILGEHVPLVCPFLKSGNQLSRPIHYKCRAANRRITEGMLWKMGRVPTPEDLWEAADHPCHHDQFNPGYMECPVFSKAYWKGRIKGV